MFRFSDLTGKLWRLATVASLMASGDALAQSSPNRADMANRFGRVEVAAQASFIPLHSGDATMGKYAGVGPALRLSHFWYTRPYRAILAEASYTYTPGNDRQAKPRLQMAGLAVGAQGALGRVATVQGTTGFTRLRYEVREAPLCEPPLCFEEGGASFRDATVTAWHVGTAMTLWPIPRAGIRFDARLYKPIGATSNLGDSGDIRTELALGLGLRL